MVTIASAYIRYDGYHDDSWVIIRGMPVLTVTVVIRVGLM